jgi:cytochrome c556
VAVSETGNDDVIKQRQEAMKAMGGAMGKLAEIARKEVPFDAEVVKKSAGIIAESLQESTSLYPEGSEKGDVETWAKAEIWSDPDGFKKLLKGAHKAAMAMAEVTDEAAFGPALGQLGNGCKTCHDTYRRPKQ